MRGKSLHNFMVERAREAVEPFFDTVDTEHWIRVGQTTIYIDLFVRKGPIQLAVEIETSIRHAAGNARKAAIANVPLLMVVSNRHLKSILVKKFGGLKAGAGGNPIKILLLDELRQEVMDYLSRRIHG